MTLQNRADLLACSTVPTRVTCREHRGKKPKSTRQIVPPSSIPGTKDLEARSYGMVSHHSLKHIAVQSFAETRHSDHPPCCSCATGIAFLRVCPCQSGPCHRGPRGDDWLQSCEHLGSLHRRMLVAYGVSPQRKAPHWPIHLLCTRSSGSLWGP